MIQKRSLSQATPIKWGQIARLGTVALFGLATLWPFEFNWDRPLTALKTAPPNLSSGKASLDIAQNLLLFSSWGVVFVLTSGASASRAWWRVVAWAGLTGLTISVAIEAFQLFLPARHSSLTDIVTNTAGSIVGACAVLVVATVAGRIRPPQTYFGIPAFFLAVSYGAACFVEAVFPRFRSATLPQLWGSPVARFNAVTEAFDPQTISTLPLLESILFVPLGAGVLLAMREHGWRTSVSLALILVSSLLASAAAELARAPIGMPIVLGAIFVRWAGVCAGAALASWVLRNIGSRAFNSRWIQPAYAALLAVWILRPFTLETDLTALAEKVSWQSLLPMGAYRNMGHHLAPDIIGGFVLFLPAGMLAAAGPGRKTALPWAWFAIAAGLASCQLFIKGRDFDVSGILIGCAGIVVGWRLCQGGWVAAPTSDAALDPRQRPTDLQASPAEGP